MKTQLFQVWREGWVATEDRGYAARMGEAEADSFEEACQIVLEGNKYFDPERLTWWVCHLFPSGTLARERFG